MTTHASVIGLGYVGLPLAVALANRGVRVTGFDTNPTRIDQLKRGQSPVEDVSDAELAAALSQGLEVTSSTDAIAALDAYVICVPTPLSQSGHPDLSFIDAAVDVVGAAVTQGSLVVLESTTYPGTTEERVLPRLEEVSGLRVGTDIYLAYSPERIDPGNQTFNITNTPKIVGGVDDASTMAAISLYEHLGIELVTAKGPKEAELAKLLENTYRQVNIALVNEMSQFCYALGIDIHDAIRCAATKPFGFQAFWPGPGVGGHCIPIDPSYLSFRVRAELGYPFRFAELAQEVNASMPSFIVTRIGRALNERMRSIKGAEICLLGVAYKPGVADVRESPAREVARSLIALGANVSYWDPLVESFGVDGQVITRKSLEDLNLNPADVTVILQVGDQLLKADLHSTAVCVVDTRGLV